MNEVELSNERDEQGATTAEYAVTTLAAVSFGSILIAILTNPEVQALLMKVFIWILEMIFKMV